MKILFGFSLTLLIVLNATAEDISPVAGGLSEEQPITDNVARLTEALKDEVLSRIETNDVETFEPVSFSEQVVAGMVYYVKVKLGAKDWIHVKFYKPLFNDQPELMGVNEDVSEESPIEYF
ncbi:cystatin-A1-like [Styela clava]